MAKKPAEPSREDRLSAIFDQLIIAVEDIVKGRTPLLDENGCVVLDEQGRPYMTTVSAAHLKVALQLLDRCNFSVASAPSTEDRLTRMRREAEKRQMPNLRISGGEA